MKKNILPMLLLCSAAFAKDHLDHSIKAVPAVEDALAEKVTINLGVIDPMQPTASFDKIALDEETPMHGHTVGSDKALQEVMDHQKEILRKLDQILEKFSQVPQQKNIENLLNALKQEHIKMIHDMVKEARQDIADTE